jgi:hypothetical protein
LNPNTKQADNAQRIPIVHDANRFEFDLLLDVAFNSNGTGPFSLSSPGGTFQRA